MHDLRSHIREVPDYPKPGILFYDITPLLSDAGAFQQLLDDMAAPFSTAGITKVAGIEARGFMLAAPIAERLQAGFVPIRKPGKLPYDVRRETYELEYGTDALEIHVDAVESHDRVLLVDDVIATGGTAGAAIRLLRTIGANIAGFSAFIELVALGGRASLDGVALHALLEY